MAETSARLLRLLSLLQTRRDWTGAELAERLDVAPRTIRRDIDRLRKIGYPVDADRGLAGGYRLGSGAELPPLLLDDDEAVAIAVGLRGATAGAVNGIEESSVRALAKLEQILPDRVRRKVSAIQGFTVTLPRRGPSIDANVLTTLSAACRDRDRMRFKYQASDGTPSTRKVEPVRLAHEGQRWYVLAFDNDRDDWRTFRVDRIQGVPSSAGRYERRPEPEGGVEAYMAKMMQPWTHRERTHACLVRIGASYARTTRRISPAFADAIADGDDATVMRLSSDSMDWVAVHLIMACTELGAELQVIEGEELRASLESMSAKFARAAVSTGVRPEVLPEARAGGPEGHSPY
jgi:predicted DNA-binding transcriptional regulator YafY